MKHSIASFLSLHGRFGRRACLLLLILMAGGCAVTPPMVDPYSTLLPAGRKVEDSNTRFSAAQLKNETVYLVVGANFVTYAEIWAKLHTKAENQGIAIRLLIGRSAHVSYRSEWAPTRVTSLVTAELQKHFQKIVVVNDLAEAQAQKAKWIIMFDHAFVQATTALASWTNTTTIDLLDNNLRRVMAITFSENKFHGVSTNFSDEARIATARGEDLMRCVQTALVQFNSKLAASR